MIEAVYRCSHKLGFDHGAQCGIFCECIHRCDAHPCGECMKCDCMEFVDLVSSKQMPMVLEP